MLESLQPELIEKLCTFLDPKEVIAFNQVDTTVCLITAEPAANAVTVLVEETWEEIRNNYREELEDQFASTFVDPYPYF